MISFPTKYLILEGPDCSGKSTLHREIHKKTDYCWNIQDRSFLSMLIYAKQYGRETSLHARRLWTELNHLNNRIVLLLPTYEIILNRYKIRGDDILDEERLERVVDLFHDHDWLGAFPNVMLLSNSVVNQETLSQDVISVIDWVRTKEKCSLKDVSAEVAQFVSVMPTGSPDNMRGYESQISFDLYEDLIFEEVDPDILKDEEEGEYYRSILKKVHRKFQSELAGKNEYGEPQTARSRRFVYAEDTCISFIQFLVRDGLLDMHAVIRSTNVIKTFPKDLRFLYYLLSQIYEIYMELRPIRAARLRIQLNSAHLMR